MLMTRFYIYVIVLLIFSFDLSAQNVSQLKKEQQQHQQEITYINSLLKKTLRNKKVSLGQLNLLNRNIQLRQNIINSIEKELVVVNNQLSKANNQIHLLEKDLKQMKQQYAKLIVYAHKQRKTHEKLMFILASKDLNQAYKRFKYLQKVTESIEKQGKNINAKKQHIGKQISQLKKQKTEKKRLLAIKSKEKHKLNNQKREQNRVVQQLQKKERKLRSDLRKQKRYARKLERKIQEIIRLQARKNHKKTGKYGLTPAEKKLSQQFGDNKGKLPWPTKTGFISQSFGTHQHPILKHVKVRNDGVDITTDNNAECRAVFGGIVSHVLPMPGLNNVVLIQHGAYFTVYSNLASVSVKKGDKVDLKQKLGIVYTDKNKKTTILKFQLWKGSTKLNPASWLLRKR